MKRHGNLFEKVISVENLFLAEKKARKGKRGNPEILRFLNNLEENIQRLHKDLFNNNYVISEYSHFIIYEPKERKISKLPYRDRIVHHAIILIIGPILLKSFISQTYSCIKFRGIYKGLRILNNYLKDTENTKYCLKMDLKKFYPSINHGILRQLLKRKFKDQKLLKLLDLVISSHNGLPLGNFTSQWFANFYLNSFCHWLKEKKQIKHCLIYCDDIVILGNDKSYLHQLRKDIEEYLLLNLDLKLSKYQVYPISSRGIDFLGYVSFHTHIRLRKRIKKNWLYMLKKFPNKKSKASYNGWLCHSNSINLQNKYLNNG